MADTRGGFELPREGEAAPQHPHDDAHQPPPPPPLRALTDRQQTRLSAYLDTALTKLSRGFLRRHEPQPTHTPRTADDDAGADWLPTLAALLAAWAPLLGLVVRVPPSGTSAPLLVSYLLRATADLTEQITGYNLGERGSAEEAAHSLDAQLRAIVTHLDALDRIWADLLRALPIEHHQHRLQQLAHAFAAATASSAGDQHHARPGLSTDPSGRFHHASAHDPDARPWLHSFPPPPTPASVRGSGPPSHMPLHTPISQTERIRLRNLVLLARDRLFRWMRDVLDAPPPPEIEEGAEDDPPRDGAADSGGRIVGHGSRVAALLRFDAAQQRSPKRRRTSPPSRTAAAEEEHLLEQDEADFAQLAGEQGDLDAGFGPLRDEPLDEPDDDRDIDPTPSGPDADEGMPEMVDVIDDDEPAPPSGSASTLRQLGTGGDGDDVYRDSHPEDVEGGGEIGREHKHYADLFSRRLDPDASDDDDDDPGQQDVNRNANQSNGKTQRNGSTLKRPHSPIDSHDHQTDNGDGDGDGDPDDDDDARTVDPSFPAGTASASAAVVGQWDLEFSRLFRRTLRLLVESDDRARARADAQAKAGAGGISAGVDGGGDL